MRGPIIRSRTSWRAWTTSIRASRPPARQHRSRPRGISRPPPDCQRLASPAGSEYQNCAPSLVGLRSAGMVAHIFDDGPERARGKIAGLYGFLFAVNIGAWLWAVAAFHGNAFLLGTAFLAYSFGLRHAFDADHIAAIDNITRKLMQEGRRALAVGFVFSLGHATVVVALVLIIAPMSAAAQQHFA